MHKQWKIYGRMCGYFQYSFFRREARELEITCYKQFINRSKENKYNLKFKNLLNLYLIKREMSMTFPMNFTGNSYVTLGQNIAEISLPL